MSNRRKPQGPLIARRFPLQLRESPTAPRRRVKARLRVQWVRELACKWDVAQGRDRGCHNAPWPCVHHPREAVSA